MANKNQEKIKKNLQQIHVKLLETYRLLLEENRNGNQYDYCTDASLASLSSSVKVEATKIDRIVYQEVKL
jgi:hypothetical protein